MLSGGVVPISLLRPGRRSAGRSAGVAGWIERGSRGRGNTGRVVEVDGLAGTLVR